jgi:hypothetical protein
MGTGITVSKANAQHAASMPGFEGRYAREDGFNLGFESFESAVDFTPMYRGLPDDLCQSPHWGYVIKGRMIFHRPEGDLIAEEGEAYYVGPGHTGEVAVPGTEVVEFSPLEEYDRTMAVVAKNLEAMAGS